MANYIKIRGNHYQIGYQVGKWWGNYFKNNLNKRPFKRLFNNYETWLKNSWDLSIDYHPPLLENAINCFPEIILEIAGMEKGVCETGFQVSFLDMFCLCLGEDDELDYNCSSAVLIERDMSLLVHNEENDDLYPMLVADVRLETILGKSHFISISYPFQLLGSAGGMNEDFAFSSNSIGCKDQEVWLRETRHGRLPKTFFSRKMLELETAGKAIKLLSKHHTTLPNHLYVISHNKAFSIEIRPVSKVYESPKKQMRIKKILEGLHLHTNHFINQDDSVDLEWVFHEAGFANSLSRQNYLQERIHGISVDRFNLTRIFEKMARTDFKDQSSSAFVFKLTEKMTDFTGKFYFSDGFVRKCYLKK